jgi:DNA-directed RNA polymerase subunit E'/Rpb7
MIIKGMSIFLKQSMIVSSDRVSLHKEFISLENKKYIEACVRARIVWKERKEKKKKGDREKRRERLVRASRVSAA